MMCKYWIELDDDSGSFEYCRFYNRKCICCGELSQCPENKEVEY